MTLLESTRDSCKQRYLPHRDRPIYVLNLPYDVFDIVEEVNLTLDTGV